MLEVRENKFQLETLHDELLRFGSCRRKIANIVIKIESSCRGLRRSNRTHSFQAFDTTTRSAKPRQISKPPNPVQIQYRFKYFISNEHLPFQLSP
ncbi:hypothetical protein AVEN_191431-1 [Araneus ventricosus]|uniref:Uncharacterized protein n=1 Tax=Araneus ventricosus TaxID=182803 RepID=A0A4Y2WBG6_ARAVE|nr:hypothetical protein AVEN_191431-1 [Araneus ventricosus]